jgi:hypothetical protein
MLRSMVFVVCAFVAWAGSPAEAGAKDWWGTKLPDAPTQYIFGYGSLINTASRNSTATTPIPAIPVRVSQEFGYIRTWNDRSPSGFTALGLRKPNPGEAGQTINGVLYPVEGSDMSKFDAREEGYARVEVPLSQIEAVGWQRIPETGHVWVYVPVRSTEQGGSGVPGKGLPAADASFPLLESYIDVVVEGGLEYGQDYAREILETTDGWNQYWLNDRELARRPWVHDAKAAAVDALLKTTPGPQEDFKARLFAEPYADRWIKQNELVGAK